MRNLGKRALPIAAALMLAGLASTAFAQSIDGKVKKVDEAAGKITLTHGAIKKFDMGSGMTMVYRVKDPAMLKGLKAGDKVMFDADKINGRFTVTEIKKR